ECRAARIRGELPSHVAEAQCVNTRIRDINQRAASPFMDLGDLLAAVRLADAEKVDKRQMTEAEAMLHVAQVRSQLTDQARRRVLEAKTVDIQAKTAQSQVEALEVQARAAQVGAQAAREQAQAAQEGVRLQADQLQQLRFQRPQSF